MAGIKDHGPDFYCDFAFNLPNKKMEACICTNKYGYSYSNEPIIGNGDLKEIEVDEVEVFKVKAYWFLIIKFFDKN